MGKKKNYWFIGLLFSRSKRSINKLWRSVNKLLWRSMVSQLKATRISNKGKIVILCFETKRSFDCYFVNSPNRVNGKGQRVINIRWNTVKKNCAFKKN